MLVRLVIVRLLPGATVTLRAFASTSVDPRDILDQPPRLVETLFKLDVLGLDILKPTKNQLYIGSYGVPTK